MHATCRSPTKPQQCTEGYKNRVALAKALSTSYKAERGFFPPNPNWNDHSLNSYSVGYIPDARPFITIDAFGEDGDQPHRSMIFSLNTKRQAVTWKPGTSAAYATPVPEDLQDFFLQLTETVHDIAARRTRAQELKCQREEAKKYYEANKEKIDAERELKRRKTD
ncbi:unnamed protein product [Calypogeia fissa]